MTAPNGIHVKATGRWTTYEAVLRLRKVSYFRGVAVRLVGTKNKGLIDSVVGEMTEAVIDAGDGQSLSFYKSRAHSRAVDWHRHRNVDPHFAKHVAKPGELCWRCGLASPTWCEKMKATRALLCGSCKSSQTCRRTPNVDAKLLDADLGLDSTVTADGAESMTRAEKLLVSAICDN